MGIYINSNSCGMGLLLPHPGFIRIGPNTHMGNNCTILPMVLFGRKSPELPCPITVGNNCYFGTGCCIMGPLTIGDNVTVGAGAVVTKDIPSNCIVAGVPAKVIK